MSDSSMSTYKGVGDNYGSSPYCLEKDLQPEILRHIFTFVGGYEYRFVATVSKTFCSLYSEQFPSKLTNPGLSVFHAKVYLDERNFISYLPDSEKYFMEIKMENILEQAVVNNNFDVIEVVH